MKEISRKDIEEAFKNLKVPSIEHYEGEGLSVWTVKIPGSITISTGDAGYKEFCEAMRRDMESWKDKT
jgi:hypothetical protein